MYAMLITSGCQNNISSSYNLRPMSDDTEAFWRERALAGKQIGRLPTVAGLL